MQTFFQDNKSDELILFFNGWSIDEKPFYPLKSNLDVLFISDYSNLDLSSDIDFSKYKKLILITFSAGVFMAAYLQDMLPDFDLKIAVNGTLYPQNDQKGFPKEIFSALESITLENALEARKKFINQEEHYNLFNKHQPSRDLQSAMDELLMLKKYFSEPKYFDYDKIIIGENDNIIPYENQLRAWDNHKNIQTIKDGHFLFYNFNNFEELINL